jgi:hypothetical protein
MRLALPAGPSQKRDLVSVASIKKIGGRGRAKINSEENDR